MVKKRVSPVQPEPQPELNELLDIEGLQKKFGIGRTLVFQLIKKEGLPTIYLSRRVLRFDPCEVAVWLQKRASKSA